MADSSNDPDFDLEEVSDRDELAARFREFAATVAGTEPLRLTDGDRTATVTIPSHVSAAFELDHDADAEPPVSKLTLELEWEDLDGSSLSLVADSETDSEPAADQQRERTSRFEVYEDRADEWRWRLVHWNGNIIADSGEGYASRSNAKRAVRGVMRSVPTATIEDGER